MNFYAIHIDFKIKIRTRDNVICDISGFICIVKKCEYERRNPRYARTKLNPSVKPTKLDIARRISLANGEITPPAKKDGLSGGQVAGIVIGTLLLAGIGGFAVLWFAVKKKAFADLGVGLKKGFTAIGNFFKTLGAKIKALFAKKK